MDILQSNPYDDVGRYSTSAIMCSISQNVDNSTGVVDYIFWRLLSTASVIPFIILSIVEVSLRATLDMALVLPICIHSRSINPPIENLVNKILSHLKNLPILLLISFELLADVISLSSPDFRLARSRIDEFSETLKLHTPYESYMSVNTLSKLRKTKKECDGFGINCRITLVAILTLLINLMTCLLATSASTIGSVITSVARVKKFRSIPYFVIWAITDFFRAYRTNTENASLDKQILNIPNTNVISGTILKKMIDRRNQSMNSGSLSAMPNCIALGALSIAIIPFGFFELLIKKVILVLNSLMCTGNSRNFSLFSEMKDITSICLSCFLMNLYSRRVSLDDAYFETYVLHPKFLISKWIHPIINRRRPPASLCDINQIVLPILDKIAIILLAFVNLAFIVPEVSLKLLYITLDSFASLSPMTFFIGASTIIFDAIIFSIFCFALITKPI